jgi:tetratricopeptide (TPR) repeat protein
MHEEAREHLDAALALRRAEHDGPHLDVVESLRLLAAGARDERRLDDARALGEEALALLDELGPGTDEERARCLGDLSMTCFLAGDEDRARDLWSRSMALLRRVHGDDHVALATALSRLGGLHLARMEYAEGIQALDRAVAMRRRLGRGEHLDQAWDAMNLAEGCAALGREQEAEEHLLEAQRILVLLLGEDHPGSILCQARLALIAMRTVGPEPARDELRRALEREPELAGRTHAAVPPALDVLGLVARSTGDLARSEELFRSSLAASERLLLDRTPGAAVARTNLAAVLSSRGRTSEAAELCREAIAILRERPGGDSAPLVDALLTLAFQFQNEGDLAPAAEHAREAYDAARRLFEPPHPMLAQTAHGLGWLLYVNGRAEEAAELLGEALAMQRVLQPELDAELANMRTKLGTVLAELGQLDRAVTELRAGLAVREQLYGTFHPAIVDSRLSLGSVLVRSGELDEAQAQLEDALSASRLLYGDHSSTIRCLNELAELHFRAERFEQARELMLESIAVSRRALAPRSTGLAFNLYNAVRALGPLGRLAEAEPLLEESLDIYLEQLGPDHARTRTVRAELATVRRLLGAPAAGEAP